MVLGSRNLTECWVTYSVTGTFEQVRGERLRFGRVDFEYLAPELRSAGDLGDAVDTRLSLTRTAQ